MQRLDETEPVMDDEFASNANIVQQVDVIAGSGSTGDKGAIIV